MIKGRTKRLRNRLTWKRQAIMGRDALRAAMNGNISLYHSLLSKRRNLARRFQ